MSNPSPPLSPPPADPAAYAGSVLRRQIARLDELADSGLAMAREFERRAVEPAPEGESAPPPETLAMAFSRVARAVRMTSLLQARLLKEMDEGARRADFGRQWAANHPAPQPDPAAIDDAEIEAALNDPAFTHKVRVERIVERVARSTHDDDDSVERLLAEAGERLDDEDLYGDVLTRPIGELVSLICRDLGLDPDWERLSQEAWAQEEMTEAPPGSPFLVLAQKEEPPRAPSSPKILRAPQAPIPSPAPKPSAPEFASSA